MARAEYKRRDTICGGESGVKKRATRHEQNPINIDCMVAQMMGESMVKNSSQSWTKMDCPGQLNSEQFPWVRMIHFTEVISVTVEAKILVDHYSAD